MKKFLLVLLIFITHCLIMEGSNYRNFDKLEKSTINKNLSFNSNEKSLEIDNIFGKVNVKGYKGDVLKLKILKTIKARTKAALKKARDEVKLDISNDKGKISLYVNGPFRNKEKNMKNWNTKKLGYIVQYDMDILVPERIGLVVKTVTEGNIDIRNIVGKCKVRHANGKIYIEDLKGDFNIKTANGKVEIIKVDGSGKVLTANGKVYVKFVKNPVSDCDFKTINGNVDIRFLSGLSGKFNLKTMHGKILSDFPYQYLPVKQKKGIKKDGMFIYRSNQFKSINIGKEGPAISMETLNGSLIIGKGE